MQVRRMLFLAEESAFNKAVYISYAVKATHNTSYNIITKKKKTGRQISGSIPYDQSILKDLD